MAKMIFISWNTSGTTPTAMVGSEYPNTMVGTMDEKTEMFKRIRIHINNSWLEFLEAGGIKHNYFIKLNITTSDTNDLSGNTLYKHHSYNIKVLTLKNSIGE